MLAVERLEDRQAFFEAGNPVASVEFGLFHRRRTAQGCAVIAQDWAIIARIRCIGCAASTPCGRPSGFLRCRLPDDPGVPLMARGMKRHIAAAERR
ncbi:hypothetical protein [Burkholderia pseudomultivorans]|uniref:hypothetical protein n=1 Tax=Burkholderia pseudomultivorans TaxID=1207504 RepID=UPI001581A62A|nr:hypothetical protein [Burkholderia pseudomultivorans]